MPTPNFILKKKAYLNCLTAFLTPAGKIIIIKKLWTLDKTRLGSSSKSSSRFGFEAGSRAGS
jgi:hypothetical protein